MRLHWVSLFWPSWAEVLSLDTRALVEKDSFTKRAALVLAGGLGAFVVALLWGAICVGLGLASPAQMHQAAQFQAELQDVPRYIIAHIVLSPLLETIPFVILLWLCRKLPRGKIQIYGYLAAIFLLGWALHGATLLSVGRGVAFAVVGLVMATSQARRGFRAAYIDAACAHAVWNVLATLFILCVIAKGD